MKGTTMSNRNWNRDVATLAREAGVYTEVLAQWKTLDRSLSPKKAVRAIVTSLDSSTPAKVTSTKAPAKKAPKKAPAKRRVRKVSTEARTERVVLNHGQARVMVREAGKIVANRPATKAEAKAAGLKGSTAKKTPKASKSATVSPLLRPLSKRSREAYFAAAMEQDGEYLDAIREFHGFEGRNPSVKEMAFYALDVQLEVPGFVIGEGYRTLFAAKA